MQFFLERKDAVLLNFLFLSYDKKSRILKNLIIIEKKTHALKGS